MLWDIFFMIQKKVRENNSFYNSSGRKCPPDTVQTHKVFPRIIASGILALVKRMLMMLDCFKSGYGTDGSKLDAQKGFAESDDNQIADSSCNGRRFVEEDRGDRGWCKDKDQSDQ